MTITMNKNAARAITTAAAMAEYIAENDARQTDIIEAMIDEYNEFMMEMAIREAEHNAWLQDMADLDAAWKCGEETGDYSFYSDVYKDVYGVRPRIRQLGW